MIRGEWKVLGLEHRPEIGANVGKKEDQPRGRHPEILAQSSQKHAS